MHLQCTMSSIDWEVRRLGHSVALDRVRKLHLMRNESAEACRVRLGMRERVKTRNDNGLRIWIFSQKLPFSVGKKMFQRQI